MQCSIHPLRWLACISKRNHTYRIACASPTLVVHLLHDDQHALAELFGAETGDAIDKFRRCSWRAGPDGVPVIDGCDWIAGRVLERFDLGDHVGHLLEVFESGHEHADSPQLGFQRVRDISPGHEP
jgi:flavin reductase (DIM6/NTAB) family NADH-FMN oxidoreductase RutF